jgi:hypothetical protein
MKCFQFVGVFVLRVLLKKIKKKKKKEKKEKESDAAGRRWGYKFVTKEAPANTHARRKRRRRRRNKKTRALLLS